MNNLLEGFDFNDAINDIGNSNSQKISEDILIDTIIDNLISVLKIYDNINYTYSNNYLNIIAPCGYDGISERVINITFNNSTFVTYNYFLSASYDLLYKFENFYNLNLQLLSVLNNYIGKENINIVFGISDIINSNDINNGITLNFRFIDIYMSMNFIYKGYKIRYSKFNELISYIDNKKHYDINKNLNTLFSNITYSNIICSGIQNKDEDILNKSISLYSDFINYAKENLISANNGFIMGKGIEYDGNMDITTQRIQNLEIIVDLFRFDNTNIYDNIEIKVNDIKRVCLPSRLKDFKQGIEKSLIKFVSNIKDTNKFYSLFVLSALFYENMPQVLISFAKYNNNIKHDPNLLKAYFNTIIDDISKNGPIYQAIVNYL